MSDWNAPYLPPLPEAIADRVRRAGALPQEIAPGRDCPLGLLHRLGWALLDHSNWPASPFHNPLVSYLIDRRRLTGLLFDFLGLSPWLLLLAAESVLLVHAALSVRHLGHVLQFALLQLLLLPLLSCLVSIAAVIVHFHRATGRFPLEEISVTRINDDEILAGLTLRPVLVQVAAPLLAGLASITLLLGFTFAQFVHNSLFSLLTVVLLLAIVFYRSYLLVRFNEFASLRAIRAVVFIPGASIAFLRAVRDVVFPWALIPVAFPFVIVGAFWIQQFTVIFFYFVVLVPLLGILFLHAFPSMLRTYNNDLMYWVRHAHRHWTIRTGEVAPAVPASLFAPWKLEKRLR